jgi:hypothetical protein
VVGWNEKEKKNSNFEYSSQQREREREKENRKPLMSSLLRLSNEVDPFFGASDAEVLVGEVSAGSPGGPVPLSEQDPRAFDDRAPTGLINTANPPWPVEPTGRDKGDWIRLN